MYAYTSALCIIACKTSSKSYRGCFQSIQYFILSQRERCARGCVCRVCSEEVPVSCGQRATIHPTDSPSVSPRLGTVIYAPHDLRVSRMRRGV